MWWILRALPYPTRSPGTSGASPCAAPNRSLTRPEWYGRCALPLRMSCAKAHRTEPEQSNPLEYGSWALSGSSGSTCP